MAVTVGGYVCMKKSDYTKLKNSKVSGTKKRKSVKRKATKRKKR